MNNRRRPSRIAIRIEPLTAAIIAMNAQATNVVATRAFGQAIHTTGFISTESLHAVTTLVPLINYLVHVDEPPMGLRLFTRFEFLKDEKQVWTWIEPHAFDDRNVLFLSSIGYDLASFASIELVEGLWTLKVSVATAIDLELEAHIERDRVKYIKGLSYQEIFQLKWEVIVGSKEELTPTGELKHPRARTQRKTVTVSIEDV